MLRVDRCRDMDKLINFWARSGSRNRIYTGLLHFSGISEEVMGGFSWIWMKCCVSTDIWTWTNWLTFEPDPDHSPYLGTGFTPDFWILTGYLKKLWTDFDEILCVDSCGGLHDLVRFWAGSGSQFGSWNRIYTGFLNFSGISEEVIDGFQWHFMHR